MVFDFFETEMIFLLWTYCIPAFFIMWVSEWVSHPRRLRITRQPYAIPDCTVHTYDTLHDKIRLHLSNHHPSRVHTCRNTTRAPYSLTTLTPNNARSKLFFPCLYCRLIGSSILPHHVDITKARRCIWRDRIRRICSLRAPREEGICSNRCIP